MRKRNVFTIEKRASFCPGRFVAFVVLGVSLVGGLWGCQTAAGASGERGVSLETEEGAEAVQYEELSRFGRDEDARDPRELFYGPLQARVEAAQEEWLSEFRACLQRGRGEEGALREIIFDVVRSSAEETFVVNDLQVNWGEEGDESCANEAAEGFVATVGGTPYDGYDHYVVSWVMRPDPGLHCGVAGVECAWLQGESARAGSTQGEECPVEFSSQVEARLRGLAQRCFSPRNLSAPPAWEDPHTGRALVVSDLWIIDGIGLVQISSPTPWLKEVAGCMADGLREGDDEVVWAWEDGQDGEAGPTSCRRELRNFGVTFGSLPVFTRVESP